METLAVSASAAVLKPVIDKLSSQVWKNVSMFWRLDKKCGKLKEELGKINHVLDDAEKKSITDELIRHWLWKLQDVAFDIEDFLDGLQEAQRREQNKSPIGKMQVFFSSDNQLKFRASMVIRLKKISKRLGKIIEEKKKFELVDGHVLMEEDQIKRETNAAVIESELFGRKEEKEKLIDLLIHGNHNTKLSILALVGMGGVGKTTLAQIIYNDPEIKKHFFPVIWVHVPMNFELKEILRKLIECISGKKCDVLDEEPMKNKLQTLISGDNFLLVLDDVWNENATKWNGLRIILNCGGLRSKILVTTRSGRVAEIMRAFAHFRVNPLEFEHCWELFKRRAFPQMNENENENAALVNIGKEIVRKCKGLPLAAEHLGNLAGRLRSIQNWSAIRDSELWQIEKDYKREVQVVPSLLLSYFYLPSHLKWCFAYCSLFSKGFFYEKEQMIQLWTCEGFIPKMELESNLCFDYLLSRSFFEKSEEITWGPPKYRMHDLIHDLACYVAEDKFFLRSVTGINQNMVSWRYASSNVYINKTDKPYMKKLRTLLLPDNNSVKMEIDCIMQLQFLRILDLSRNQIKELPQSIGNLKLLKFLNLSRNPLRILPKSVATLWSLEVFDLSLCKQLKAVPNDLGALENLEVLDLQCCYSIIKLPVSLNRLTKLKILDLHHCESLISIPKGIGKLTKLEKLPWFIVGSEDGCTIGELEQLNLLKHDIEIVIQEERGLQDISNANFRAKQHLKSLNLHWRRGNPMGYH